MNKKKLNEGCWFDTDDGESFENLESAIKYANGKYGSEVNTITKKCCVGDDDVNCDTEKVVWTREKGNTELTEGASNFNSLYNMPLLVFYTIDEAYNRMDYDDENPRNNPDDYATEEDMEDAFDDYEEKFMNSLAATVLDEVQVENLQNDIADLNGELKGFAYELEDEQSDSFWSDDKQYDYDNPEWTQADYLESIKFSIEPGYYEAAQINCEGDQYFKKLDKKYQDFILKALKDIKEKYGLTELGVSYRANNGETGYHKVESLKEDSNNQQVTRSEAREIRDAIESEQKLYEKEENGKKYAVRTWEDGRYVDIYGNVITRNPAKALKFDTVEEAEREASGDGAFKNWDDVYEIVELTESTDGKPKASDYKKLVKKHRASNKKGARGNNDGFGKPKNTDPKRNMEIFNHMMGSDKGEVSSSSSSEGGSDGSTCVSCGESLDNNRVSYQDVLNELTSIQKPDEYISVRGDKVYRIYGSEETYLDMCDKFGLKPERVDDLAYEAHGNGFDLCWTEEDIQLAVKEKEECLHEEDEKVKYTRKVGREIIPDGKNTVSCFSYEEPDFKHRHLGNRNKKQIEPKEYDDFNKKFGFNGETLEEKKERIHNVLTKHSKRNSVNEEYNEYWNEFDSELQKIGATEEEIEKALKLANDYEKVADIGVITNEQMDEVANAMGLKDIPTSELGRTWELYYDAISREAFSDEDGSTEKFKKYRDAASAFAEVINRESRARRRNESLNEDGETIEDIFHKTAGKKFDVFDKNGHFTKDAVKMYDKVANSYKDGADEFDKLCSEEKCFEESITKRPMHKTINRH